ncbi:MAG: RsmD family RNA methyltransferase [Alphaproteobacteria bacterium]|nr:RsmD family RNA methyltransferase [Alphaproteobacteria bacterium]
MSLNIISGCVKGMTLASPPISAETQHITRPSSSRLRAALIDIIRHHADFDNINNMLDLCAGSGAIGLEFLSNNLCQHALFVENHPTILRILQQNIAKIMPRINANSEEATSKIITQNAYQLTTLPILPEIIFVDPPYADDSAQLCLNLQQQGLLQQCRLLIVQTAPKQILNLPFALADKRKYGNAMLHFYRPYESAS